MSADQHVVLARELSALLFTGTTEPVGVDLDELTEAVAAADVVVAEFTAVVEAAFSEEFRAATTQAQRARLVRRVIKAQQEG